MAFEPDARPTLIGSLPLSDHREATRLILEYMDEIPLWVQLPSYSGDRLLPQFAENLPGLRGEGDRIHFDTKDSGFEAELLAFYEAYLAVLGGEQSIDGSIFALSEATGRGFRVFLEEVGRAAHKPYALKGQMTGPFTMLTGLKDQDGRLAYFDPQLREAVVKGLTLKGRYQVEKMRALNDHVILFLDEPALSGFGSSAMVSIPREHVVADLSEVIETVHSAGGLAGVHVCANTDWSLLFSTPVDIVSFDAYGYFDRFLLFKDLLKAFLEAGKTVAWGLIPTLNPEDLQKEDLSSLKARWDEQVNHLGIAPEIVRRRALITPSCGTGLLPLELSQKALKLTRDLSHLIRQEDAKA